MKYCSRCLYPENAKPTIIFDDSNICSGCRYNETRRKQTIDWDERDEMFRTILDEAKEEARIRGNIHDCIIPVGGGKDSTFQVWLMTKKYNMNPLLVTFNHLYNSPVGIKNLRNLVEKSGCDIVRYNMNAAAVKKISLYMLKTVGDLTWHYHAGIKTFPIQEAVRRNIPLIIWGEHGFAELTGLVTLEDFVEFTKWSRKEHDMRGIEADQLVGNDGITEQDIAPFIYPDDDDIERVDLRGIYLSNFIKWDAKKQTELIIREWNFNTVTYDKARTFNLHSKLDDHANDVHDYLKYLKFGYGRATDDASNEIRNRAMTREKGIEMVRRYDAVEPPSLQFYCDFLGISKQEFYDIVEPMRDLDIWEQDPKGVWKTKTSVADQLTTHKEETARLPQAGDQVFDEVNQQFYFNPDIPPQKTGDKDLDDPSIHFIPM